MLSKCGDLEVMLVAIGLVGLFLFGLLSGMLLPAIQ